MPTRFDQTTARPTYPVKPSAYNIPPGMTVTRETPVRAATVESEFLVPLLVALTTGLLGFITVAIALSWFDVSGVWFWRVCGLAGTLLSVAVWMAHVVDWRRLVWQVETITNKDIDKDGSVGQPDIVIETKIGERRTVFTGLPEGIEYDKLLEFAADVTGDNPQSLALRHWRKHFGRDEDNDFLYDLLLKEFHKRRWVRWVNPKSTKSGRILTRSGEEMLEQLAQAEPHDLVEAPPTVPRLEGP